jgi:hypothetical protein
VAIVSSHLIETQSDTVGLQPSPPDWLRVFEHESGQSGYKRIFDGISSILDADGLNQMIEDIGACAGRTDHRLIVQAFLDACMRRRAPICGTTFDARVVLFPVLLRGPAEEPLPDYIEPSVTTLIQEKIHATFTAAGVSNAFAIPVDRLYSSLQFEQEQQENFYEAMTQAMRIMDVEPDSIPNRIVMPGRLSLVDDDEAFFAQGMVITYKLLPIILFTPQGMHLPDALANHVLLNEISHLIALCAPLTAPNWSTQVTPVEPVGPELDVSTNFDRVFSTNVQVLNATISEHAEIIARTFLSIEKLMLEVSHMKLSESESFGTAEIVVNANNNSVEVMWTITSDAEENFRCQCRLSMTYGFTAYSLALRIADGFDKLGFSTITTSSTDAAGVNYGIKAMLH